MKKKLLTSIVCFAMCGAMVFGATGCKKTTGGRDPETSPLKLAIGAVDQNFNPLFYTAANDGEIANMTQASLVTSKIEMQGSEQVAVLAYGNDQPTFALDYIETYYDASGKAIGYGKGGTSLTGSSSAEGSTTYEFVIKKGVKDSMGVEMNVMDVLFNFYVLLDRSYSGSSTIYSTKIKGLQAYRQQDPNAIEGSEGSNAEYYTAAQVRIDELISWSEGKTELSEQGEKDLEKVKEFYKQELTSDWNSVQTSWVETYKDYTFTEEWQAFMFVEGLVQRQSYTNATGGTSYRQDENGKYMTTLDPDPSQGNTVVHQELIEDIAEVTEGKSETEALEARKNYCIDLLYENNTMRSGIKNILTYNTTATSALDFFMAEERSEAMKTEDGSLKVPNISGITVYHSDKLENKYDSSKTVDLGEDYDILRIEISGVDPKAKWNFAIPVTPMHYYSDEEHYNAAMASYNNDTVYTSAAKDFGVECNDIKWFDSVVAADYKNTVPVGAGAYKAVNNNYTDISESQLKNGTSTFFDNNTTRFARNTNFETFGDGVQNAIINRVQIQVISDDQIVDSLKTGLIDYGTPTATSTNQNAVNTGTLKSIKYLTGGYGYVGINPKYVPDIEVREAIMHVFNTSRIINYYGKDLATIISRPVSMTSWAYPEDADYYEMWTDEDQIIEHIESSRNWVYNEATKKMEDRNGNQMSLTFTLAGETTDHPAFDMFTEAAATLEKCGIKVTVTADVTALKKLVTGDLAIWAAAWSSSIDPDPYQIYSADSQASSTKNWYKDGIVSDATGTFEKEQIIVEELTQLIDDGRSTLNQTEREEIYAQCYDLIMDLAVEFPTYQRYDLFVYDSAVIEASSLTPNPSYLMGPTAELWKVAYVK